MLQYQTNQQNERQDLEFKKSASQSLSYRIEQ